MIVTAKVCFLDASDLNLTIRRILKETKNVKVTQDDLLDRELCNKFDVVIYKQQVIKSRW
jgi:hypothetical protein